MAVIYSYPKLSTLQDKDLLLISDVSSKNKPTNRVELGTIRTYINSFVDTGVSGSGTTDTVPIWTDSQELGDSPLVLINDVPPVMQVNGSFQVFEPNDPLPRTSLKQLSGPGFRAQSPDIGTIDNRSGYVRVGGGSGRHSLNLYTLSNFSDPTNFTDAKAFEYDFNDGYTFARIEAEDYSVNINPLWEVGDVDGETTGFAWRVNFGEYAELSRTAFSPFTAFKVTPDSASIEAILPSNFPDDTAAAAAGILVGGLYHTAGVVKIRVT